MKSENSYYLKNRASKLQSQTSPLISASQSAILSHKDLMGIRKEISTKIAFDSSFIPKSNWEDVRRDIYN